VLIAIPYITLAKKAFNKNIIEESLEEWERKSKRDFLCNHTS